MTRKIRRGRQISVPFHELVTDSWALSGGMVWDLALQTLYYIFKIVLTDLNRCFLDFFVMWYNVRDH